MQEDKLVSSGVARAISKMPILAKIHERFAREKPFKGLTIGTCLHLTKETAVLLLALQAGGAEIYACASNPLSTQNEVTYFLNENGIHTLGVRGDTVEEYTRHLESVAKSKPDFIIDDGADLTVLMSKMRVESTHAVGETLILDFPKGGLEETTAGVNRIKVMEAQKKLKFPIIAVNNADTKHLFDNVYGTGQSTIDGILRATNILLAGKTFVVAGYGNCGKGLAQRAKGMGCDVIITEIDPIKALQAHMDGFRVMPMAYAAKEGDIFVTVTGNKNVIVRGHMELMKKDAILANAGHFDVEIDVAAAKDLKLDILAEGRLVNLVCAEGHPSEVMDMSFSNQALGLEWLTKNYISCPVKVLDIGKDIDESVARMKLESFGVGIDILTPEQRTYMNSF